MEVTKIHQINDIIHEEFKNSKQHNTAKNLEKIEKLENIAASLNYKIEYEINRETKRIAVKIIDKNTKKIIREIPPEEILKFLKNFEKMLGLLFDRRT